MTQVKITEEKLKVESNKFIAWYYLILLMRKWSIQIYQIMNYSNQWFIVSLLKPNETYWTVKHIENVVLILLHHFTLVHLFYRVVTLLIFFYSFKVISFEVLDYTLYRFITSHHFVVMTTTLLVRSTSNSFAHHSVDIPFFCVSSFTNSNFSFTLDVAGLLFNLISHCDAKLSILGHLESLLFSPRIFISSSCTYALNGKKKNKNLSNRPLPNLF